MNREWTPVTSTVQGTADSQKSKGLAGVAAGASVSARRAAQSVHTSRFGSSYGHTHRTCPPHHADACTPLPVGEKGAIAPYTGFDASITVAAPTTQPALSAASRLRLGLVGAGSAVHISDASDIQGGGVTGAAVSSWEGVTANLFNPARRGPITCYEDDDLAKRHVVAPLQGGDRDSEDDESFAEEGAEWHEFELVGEKTAEDVVICGEASLNNFRIQNVNAEESSEVIAQSIEDLVRLLGTTGDGPMPARLRHLSLAGAEIPLWALTLLFGARSDLPCAPADEALEVATDVVSGAKPGSSGKAAAGSAVAAAAAILSYRVSQKDLQTVSEGESKAREVSQRVESGLQSNLRNHLLSLDLSGGALEPRYNPLPNPPAEANAHYRLKQSLYDPSPAVVPDTPSTTDASAGLEEDAASAFTMEATTVSAAVLLLRDALQPTKAFVPIGLASAARRVQALEGALMERLARGKREQRVAEKKAMGDEGDTDSAGPEELLVEGEMLLEALDEELEMYPPRGDGLGQDDISPVTDELYEEALEGLRRELHKWMDIPPVLPFLQALSLNNNPTLFLDSAAVAAEGNGSVDTITEPNVMALEALRSVLQLSGTAQRYQADYSTFNAMQPVGAPRGDRYMTNKLATLLLANCGLNNSTALRYLAEGLKDNTSLRKLSLASNGFGLDDADGEAFQEFSDAIGGHKSLEALDLSNNAITADMCRAIAEAIERSFESHKNDEEDVDDDDDEGLDVDDDEEDKPPAYDDLFDDIVQQEEDHPNVVVGLPPDDGDEDAAMNEEAGADEDFDPDEEGEDLDEEDGDLPTGRPPKPRRAEPEEDDADEEDGEDPDSDEVMARQALALKEAERAWRAKQMAFIWAPERILFDYGEGVARRALTVVYQREIIALKQAEFTGQRTAAKATSHREDELQKRHTRGWSHLQILSLADNPIGSDGAAALASMLRHTVGLSDDDQARARDEREKEVAQLTRRLIREKRSEIRRERREAKERAADEALRLRAEAEESPQTARGGDPSRPVIPKLAVPPRADDDEEEEEVDEAEDETIAEEEEEMEEEEIVVGEDDIILPHLPVLKDTRPGFRALHHLNVSGCKIGSKGVCALWKVLAENCQSLRTLNLSRNSFGTRLKISTDDADGDADDDAPRDRADDVEWVSPGVQGMCKGLSLNTTLVSLDLSFNKLYPNAIFALAEALNANRTLKHLNLRGNFIGKPLLSGVVPPTRVSSQEEALPQSSAFAQLLNAFVDETNGPCSLETLILDQNCLGATPVFSAVDETSATLLATLCHSSLDLLSLAGNDLTNADLSAFSNALYSMAMDKKTGLSLDGSMSGVGRRSSITDMTEDEIGGREAEVDAPVIEDEDDEVSSHRLLGNRKLPGNGGVMGKAGTSFCVNTSATLRVFDVSNNALLSGEVAGTCIARVLQFCSRLHHLSIGGCVGLGDDGFSLLCLKVGSHPAITVFAGPRIGITSLDPLTTAIQSGTAPLVAIDFSDNDILPESLAAFSSAVCELAVDALGHQCLEKGGAYHHSSSPESPSPKRGEAPPLEDSEDEDDCPPPPFDPDEEDITPAQSMQRQASRMAILAASTSQMTTPVGKGPVKGSRRPTLRYVALWGRRGLASALGAIESLSVNGLLEDYSCVGDRVFTLETAAPQSGPTVPLYDPLLGKDPSIGPMVFGQAACASYFLHRSVFDGAYGSALRVLGNGLEAARDQGAPAAQIDRLTTNVESLKSEILSMQRYMGFAPGSRPNAPVVTSTPMVNTIRHQIITALVHERRLAQRSAVRSLYSSDMIPVLEEDDVGRAAIDTIISEVRARSHAAHRRSLLSRKLEQLRQLKRLQREVENEVATATETPDDNVEDGSPVSDSGAKSLRSFGRMIRQVERLVAVESATESPASPGSTSELPTSPAKRSSREEATAVLSKELGLTEGRMLMILCQPPEAASGVSEEESARDLARKIRWKCLMNRLAMK